MGHRARAGSALVAIILAACSAPAPTPSQPWPIDPAAVADPAWMVVEPEAAPPGELVALTFPASHDRGILFAIDQAVGDGWERRALLISDANGARPIWFHASEDVAVEMVGIAGTGPDRVPIPEGLPAGAYRICTANAVENLCVPVEVLPPEPTH